MRHFNVCFLQNCFLCLNWLSPRIFFRGAKSIVMQFLLLFYCFRTKFQGGEKFSRGGGAKCLRGAPPLPPPVGESQLNYVHGTTSFTEQTLYNSLTFYKMIVESLHDQSSKDDFQVLFGFRM